jgi:hypothetical protein
MKHLALTAILVSACVPPASNQPPPAAWGAGAQQPVAAVPTAAAPGGASCRDTLACYYQCQLTDACIQTCDQQSAASTQSHAVIACMAQNQCTDNACVSMKCSAEVSACGDLTTTTTASTATATAAPAGAADLSGVSYQAPAGWTETSNASTVMYDLLEDVQAGTTDYGQRYARLAIYPPIDVRDDLGQVFAAQWQQMIVASGFKTEVVPTGMRRRLASGLALIYDGGTMDLPQGGNFYVNLYLLVAGDHAVPVLGYFNDKFMMDSTKKEPIVLAFLESIGIKGDKPSTAALFSARDIAGAWSTQAVSIGTYVTSSGSYAGDASTATYDTYELSANGHFSENFVGYHSGSAMQVEDKGTWSVEDGTLILDGKSKTLKRAIFALGQTPGGNAGIYLASSYDGYAPLDILQPRQYGNGEWYGKVTK